MQAKSFTDFAAQRIAILSNSFVLKILPHTKVCGFLKESWHDKGFGREEILKRANAAPEFCLKVEKILEEITQEDIDKVRKKFEVLKTSLL